MRFYLTLRFEISNKMDLELWGLFFAWQRPVSSERFPILVQSVDQFSS